MQRKVIGLTGPIAGGKGAVAEALKERGYAYYSLSNIVRVETLARGHVIQRKTMQDVGDFLRAEFGNHVLAERTANLIEGTQSDRIVIDGIRNPAEINCLQQRLGARIVGVTASPERRFEFLLSRNRASDPKTKEEFDRLEQRDRGIGQDSHGQQVEACLRIADIVIENSGTLEGLKEKVQEALSSLGIEGGQPSKERLV